MRRGKWFGVSALAVLLVLALSAAVGVIAWRLLPHSGFETRAAAFGDVAGSVFSALAFAGLIVTALMQREELSLQREELRATREELKGSRAAQEGSERALQAQVEVARKTARLNALAALIALANNEERTRLELNRDSAFRNVFRSNQPQLLREAVEEIFEELGLHQESETDA